MFIALKSIHYQAEQRMEKNKAQVKFACGDFDNSDSYWGLPKGQPVKDCRGESCPESLWMRSSSKTEDLLVVSIVKPRPTEVIDGETKPGYFVDLNFETLERPTRLVLVSQRMLQWNFHFPHEGVGVVRSNPTNADKMVLDWSLESLANHQSTGLSHLQEVMVVTPELVWLD